jgi:hypothetical protein
MVLTFKLESSSTSPVRLLLKKELIAAGMLQAVGWLLTLNVTADERSGSGSSCPEEGKAGAEGASQEDCDAAS